jgi:hypothetical protein
MEEEEEDLLYSLFIRIIRTIEMTGSLMLASTELGNALGT